MLGRLQDFVLRISRTWWLYLGVVVIFAGSLQSLMRIGARFDGGLFRGEQLRKGKSQRCQGSNAQEISARAAVAKLAAILKGRNVEHDFPSG